MANFCISGQPQEYLGFVKYLVYQTLFPTIRNTTQVQITTSENVKDYSFKGQHSGQDEDAAPTVKGVHRPTNSAGEDIGTNRSIEHEFNMSDYAGSSNLRSAIDSKIADINTSWGDDLTVDKLVFSVYGIANYGSQLYGAPWVKTETDTISTTEYDKVEDAGGNKIIHVSWNDTSDSNNHWMRTMARYEAMANAGSIDWDERRKSYARNVLGITYPSSANDYKLSVDKILDKDDTEYANLCTFLGVSALSAATWKSYVDSYLTAIA